MPKRKKLEKKLKFPKKSDIIPPEGTNTKQRLSIRCTALCGRQQGGNYEKNKHTKRTHQNACTVGVVFGNNRGAFLLRRIY